MLPKSSAVLTVFAFFCLALLMILNFAEQKVVTTQMQDVPVAADTVPIGTSMPTAFSSTKCLANKNDQFVEIDCKFLDLSPTISPITICNGDNKCETVCPLLVRRAGSQELAQKIWN